MITSRPTGGSSLVSVPTVEQASTINTAADTSLLFGKDPPVIFLIKRKFLSKPFGEFGGLAKIIAWRLADADLGGTLRRPGEKPFKGKLKTRFPAKPREIGRFGGQMEIILATTCSTKGRLERQSVNFEAKRQFLQGNKILK